MLNKLTGFSFIGMCASIVGILLLSLYYVIAETITSENFVVKSIGIQIIFFIVCLVIFLVTEAVKRSSSD